MPGQSATTNPPERNETLKKIHLIFLDSIYSANTDMEFLKIFLDSLKKESVPEGESRFWGLFVDGVRHCYRLHLNKQSFRRQAQNMALTIQKIVDWINDGLPDDKKLHFQIIVRQKSIFMHLMKVLKKALKCDHEERMESACIEDASACINDFLGILGVLLDGYDTGMFEYHPQLDIIYKSVRDIISGQNETAKKEFLDWFDSSENDASVKAIIHIVLDTPFKVIRLKNYVKRPRKSGYRSFQWTFTQTSYSKDRPASKVEVQIRDLYMNQHAVTTHRQYKDLDKPEFSGLNKELMASVFHIDDFSKVHIVGFTKYDADDRPINPEDVYLDRKEVNQLGDTYGFAVPVVIETLSI